MEEPKEPDCKKQKMSENSSETEKAEMAPDSESQELEIDDKKLDIDEKYNNFISNEEMDKLREFQVLDEVKSNDEDSNDEDSDSSEGFYIYIFCLNLL